MVFVIVMVGVMVNQGELKRYICEFCSICFQVGMVVGVVKLRQFSVVLVKIVVLQEIEVCILISGVILGRIWLKVIDFYVILELCVVIIQFCVRIWWLVVWVMCVNIGIVDILIVIIFVSVDLFMVVVRMMVSNRVGKVQRRFVV